MKDANYRVTRPDSYKHNCIGRDDVSARQGHYVHANSASKAARAVAERFRMDTFLDVQPIDEQGELGEPTRHHRDGLVVMRGGDRYILCTFALRGCMVEDSGNDLGDLLGKVPDHISEEERLSICEVGYWTIDSIDPSDATPREITTLYEVQHYADPSEDEDVEEDESNVA